MKRNQKQLGRKAAEKYTNLHFTNKNKQKLHLKGGLKGVKLQRSTQSCTNCINVQNVIKKMHKAGQSKTHQAAHIVKNASIVTKFALHSTMT